MIFSSDDEKAETGITDGPAEILGMLIEKDPDVVSAVQKVLTAYGCYIRTRLGVNETFFGLPAGLIILELTGDNSQRNYLERDLRALKHVHVRRMVF